MQQALQTPRTLGSGGKSSNRFTGGMTPRTFQTPRTGNLGTGQAKTPKTKATPGTGAGSSGRQVGETYIMAITENKRRYDIFMFSGLVCEEDLHIFLIF
jgi:hypothetical protein